MHLARTLTCPTLQHLVPWQKSSPELSNGQPSTLGSVGVDKLFQQMRKYAALSVVYTLIHLSVTHDIEITAYVLQANAHFYSIFTEAVQGKYRGTLIVCAVST